MPANVDLSADPLIEQSNEAMSAMESEAADYFAQRDSERAAKALNPVAPALEKAAAAPAKPAPKPAAAAPAPAAPAKAPETSKVSGPPVLNKPAAKVEVPKPDPTAP